MDRRAVIARKRRRVAARPQPAKPPSPTRGGIFLERLEELRFTLVHGRAERGAHPNLIEIKVFVVQALFEYGSTGFIETL
jgi:hypothetical protein